MVENTGTDRLAPPSKDSNVEASTDENAEGSQEVDWQVRAETAESLNQKLSNDLRSELGRRNRSWDILVEDVGGMKEQLKAIGNRTASGDTESLTEDFAKIDRDSAIKTATRNWENNYAEAEAALADALMDGDTVVVDNESITRLSDSWKAAQKIENVSGLWRVVSQASKEAKLVLLQKTKETVTQIEEGATAAKKASDVKNGVHNLSIPSPSGSSGTKSRAQIANATSVDDISDEEYTKYITDS
jgi:hypothetical protein